MDQSKQQDRFRLNNKQLKRRVQRRLIEGLFTLLGYLASKELKIKTAIGLFFGGLTGMVIAYLILPE